MNKLVEARFKDEHGNIMKMYRHSEGKTGLYVRLGDKSKRIVGPDTMIYDVDIEPFMAEMSEYKQFELIQTVRQVKERELGNSDEAYETSIFKNGKFVKSEMGANFH